MGCIATSRSYLNDTQSLGGGRGPRKRAPCRFPVAHSGIATQEQRKDTQRDAHGRCHAARAPQRWRRSFRYNITGIAEATKNSLLANSTAVCYIKIAPISLNDFYAGFTGGCNTSPHFLHVRKSSLSQKLPIITGSCFTISVTSVKSSCSLLPQFSQNHMKPSFSPSRR